MLNYKTYGQGEPFIILHGLFGMLDNWQKFGKELAKNYSVFLVDQRNHGKSFHDENISYPLMAEDLLAFMEENHLYKATILGHSMGGKTAMEFALQNSDFVSRLIIVDIAPRKYDAHHNDVFDALLEVPIDEVESRTEVDEILVKHISDLGTRQFLQKNLQRKKEGGYQWKMNLDAITNHYEDILADVTKSETYEGPTLFINGGKSNYIKDSDHTEILKRFPNAQFVTIENAGHWIHVDTFDELLSVVENFL